MPTSGSWNYQVTALQRLKASVTIDEKGCWLWKYSTIASGYGACSFEGKIQPAHRVSWRLHKGDIPAGLKVLHKCDVKTCVNPDHLFLGTHQDNMDDMKAKGRSSNGLPQKGEANGWSRLKEDQVLEIRRLRGEGKTLASIGQLFGISRQHVHRITHEEAWKHI